MKRRPPVARASAPGVARRKPDSSAGPASATGPGQHERLLGLNQVLGNQAMGSLLSGGAPGLGAALEAPSLLSPGIPAPRVVRAGTAVALTVYFGKDFFLLDSRNLQAVEALAEELRFMAEPTITVDGHASAEGEAAYNQTLAQQRRDLVIALLSKDREPRPTFGGSAHGEDSPAVPESGSGEALESLRSQNRRVEIVVLPKPVPVSPSPEPPKVPRLRLTPEELLKIIPPETPEERLNRMLREPPPTLPERKKKSLEDLTNEALDNVLDRMLKGVGVKDPKKRDFIRPKLRDAIKSGAQKGVEEVIDANVPDPETNEALKKVLEAGAKQEF